MMKFFNHRILYHLSTYIIEYYGGFWSYKSKCKKNPTSLNSKIYEFYLEKYNCGISQFAEFKSNPALPHGLSGIFISSGAVIGSDCIIFQQVTIGSNTFADSKSSGAPTIGDNVFIGAGAKVIGNVKIGNNVRIGANAIVVKDVPSNSTVIIGSIRTIVKDVKLNNTYSDYTKFQYNNDN